MKCTNCGASILETDQFCPKCGAKAIKDRKCPDCGAVLREGTKFCHKCGRLIAGENRGRNVSDETLDIPIDAIERNILSETAAEIKADSRTAVKSSSPKTKRTAEESPQKKSAPAAPPKKRTVYREEEDWEEDDWEEEDWDDDDDNDEGVDVITIMTAIVGCVLLVVVAVLGYHLYRQYAPKNYKNLAEESEIESEDGDAEIPGQEMEDGWEVEIGEPETTYTLTVTHNVNVRDKPSTSGTNILKVAKEGETYSSYGSVDGEWYEILLEDGSVGYVFYEYVTVDD